MYNLSNICVIFDIFKFQGNKGCVQCVEMKTNLVKMLFGKYLNIGMVIKDSTEKCDNLFGMFK